MTKHNTKIEWTHAPGYRGETWNPVVGCDIVSKGCSNCYAMRWASQRLDGNPKAQHYAGTTKIVNGNPVWTGKVALAPEKNLLKPLHWTKPRSIFVNSMGDLFHEGVPNKWIDQVFAVMALCPQHIFMILTKRPERMRSYVKELQSSGRWLLFKHPSKKHLIFDAMCAQYEVMTSNIWLGTSVEDQATANERIPHLLDTPAAVRFLSCEPLLGAVDVQRWLKVTWQCSGCAGYFNGGHQKKCPDCGKEDYWCGSHDFNGRKLPHTGLCPSQSGIAIDWVIAGGESGPGARPMHPDWVRGLRDQCAEAGTPFFFKQWGEWVPGQLAAQEPFWDFQNGDYVDGHHLPEMDNSPNWDDGLSDVAAGESHSIFHKVGKSRAGHMLDGKTHHAWPDCVKQQASEVA